MCTAEYRVAARRCRRPPAARLRGHRHRRVLRHRRRGVLRPAHGARRGQAGAVRGARRLLRRRSCRPSPARRMAGSSSCTSNAMRRRPPDARRDLLPRRVPRPGVPDRLRPPGHAGLAEGRRRDHPRQGRSTVARRCTRRSTRSRRRPPSPARCGPACSGLILAGPIGLIAGGALGAGTGAVAAKVIDLGIPDEWVDWFKQAVAAGHRHRRPAGHRAERVRAGRGGDPLHRPPRLRQPAREHAAAPAHRAR